MLQYSEKSEETTPSDPARGRLVGSIGASKLTILPEDVGLT